MSTSDFTTEIRLSNDMIAIVDTMDSDLINRKWKPCKGKHTYYAHCYINLNGKYSTTSMHVLILERMLDRKLNRGETVDHKDGDGLNNRRGNLRLATYTQNNANTRKRKDNTTGYKGVVLDKRTGRYIAKIKAPGRKRHIGVFDTPEEAYKAYCEEAMKHFGEFARLK